MRVASFIMFTMSSFKQKIIRQQTDSKVYMERQKTPNSQQSLEAEEQSWRIDTIQLPDLP